MANIAECPTFLEPLQNDQTVFLLQAANRRASIFTTGFCRRQCFLCLIDDDELRYIDDPRQHLNAFAVFETNDYS